MEKNALRNTLARSLFFVSAAAAITACSGGSNPASGVLPQNSSVGDAPYSAPASTISTGSISSPSPAFSVAATGVAPAIVQSQSGGGACPSTTKVTLASQPAGGDLIVIYAVVNDTAYTLPAPSGFNTKDAQTGGWFREAEFYKIATGSEGTSYTIPSSCTSRALSWVVADIRGENRSSPFDQHKTTINNTTGSTYTTASLQASNANDLPIAMVAAGSSGLSVSSFTPSNWTPVGTGAYFTQNVYSGPATGTVSVHFSENTSSATNYPAMETLDLINPANGASPAPTPATSPAPTSTPSSIAGAYKFDGCVVYGPNDWFTTNLITGGSSYVSNTVDPNSAKITGNYTTAFPDTTPGQGHVLGLGVNYNPGPVNVAQSTTPLWAVQNCGPYCSTGVYNDDPSKNIPYQSSFWEQSTNAGTNCVPNGADCHVIVMTPPSGNPAGTHPCIDYESYTSSGPSFTGSMYHAGNLFVYNLNHSYDSQKQEGGPDQAGLPLLGTLDVGEDAALPSINHIAYMVVAGSDAATGQTCNTPGTTHRSCAVGGYVYPALGGPTCSTSGNGDTCSYELPMGARLRLNQSRLPGGSCNSAYPGSTSPQANKVCIQLATYGAIVMDHGGFSIDFGRKSDNTNPWNQSDIGHLNNITMNDFDVMTLGTIR